MHGLEIGQRFERYRVLQVLGSGISGISYEAEDLILHREVALKLIHPWSALTDAARRQFFRDMQSISLLVHPIMQRYLIMVKLKDSSTSHVVLSTIAHC